MTFGDKNVTRSDQKWSITKIMHHMSYHLFNNLKNQGTSYPPLSEADAFRVWPLYQEIAGARLHPKYGAHKHSPIA